MGTTELERRESGVFTQKILFWINPRLIQTGKTHDKLFITHYKKGRKCPRLILDRTKFHSQAFLAPSSPFALLICAFPNQLPCLQEIQGKFLHDQKCLQNAIEQSQALVHSTMPLPTTII